MDGEDVELPGLPAIDDAQTFLVELKIVEIGDAGSRDVLLHPRIFNELRRNIVEALSQVAEGAMGRLLHREDILHLELGENALADEKLTDGDTFAGLGHSRLQ